MDSYVTGAVIKALREKEGMTQSDLADKIGVSAKAISKWETGKGLPDISLLEPLAKVLHVSVLELMSGNTLSNDNKASNMLRSKIYICPVCGNIFHTMGSCVVSCCGVGLPVEQAEEPDEEHKITVENSDGELYIHLTHEMSKTHFISFLAYVTADRFELVKLYPQGEAQARFFKRGDGYLYWYCNRHGLMKKRIK